MGELGNNVLEKIQKGNLVRIVGCFSSRIWTDAEGNKHNDYSICAKHIEYKRTSSEEAQAVCSSEEDN